VPEKVLAEGQVGRVAELLAVRGGDVVRALLGEGGQLERVGMVAADGGRRC
jgi:hypothetical protein